MGLVLMSAICLNQDSQDAQDKAGFYHPVHPLILTILIQTVIKESDDC